MRVNVVGSGQGRFDRLSTPSVFESPSSPADPTALAALRAGVYEADLVAPPVVLPDFHHKSSMEMPSSIVVATRDTIRPTFTSASVNCGMALIALDADRPDRCAIGQFFDAVRRRYPWPPRLRRDLTAQDVVRCAAEGAAFAVERFDVDPAELARLEEGGRLDLPGDGAERLRRELPWLIVELSRMRFGTVGPSNHFVELQRGEENLDPAAALRLGVRRGQLTLQYHGGGGVLAGSVGALFGRRTRYTKPARAVMAVQKPLYHLASARSPSELRLRTALYLSRACPPVARKSREGQRMLLLNAAAMNYGFAFRLATYATLRTLAHQVFGIRSSQLVVDSPHNSIYEERVNGEDALVHRHNSCRAYPGSKLAGHPVFGEFGQALLLPGTHRTSSYLAVAIEGSYRSLHSACHGSGTIVDGFERRGLSTADERKRTTLEFRYTDGGPEEVPQLDDRGVNEALSILVENRLVRPVARMRPVAVLH